jgi:RHS repeat-associated protein
VLSASTTAATIQSLSFDFHSSSHADNGNVFQIANNRDNNRTQNFVYDPLNRINTAYTNGSNWGETYTTDPWGNLTSIARYQSKSQWETLNCAAANTKNQLNTCYTYDAAGNTIQNGAATYTYDAENRLISTAGMSYIYDADGKRVEKCTAGSTPDVCATNATGTLYWTGWGSDPLAETDLAGNVLENYVFFNGQRVARRDASTKAVHFYFSDHLGTHSLITDATGDMPPQKESDYYPYGGEIAMSGSDANHFKFTGKERDSATCTTACLDNFGARHFASVMGRFMSPDAKLMTTRHVASPQKWNKYAYVQNNPLLRIDPDGLDDYVVFRTVTSGSNTAQWAVAAASVTSQTDARGNLNTFHMVEGGDATIEAYRNALKTPNTHVVFVGHANEGTPNSKETTGVQLENGVTEKTGGSTAYKLVQGPDPTVPSQMTGAGSTNDPIAAGNSVALFACDSYNLASNYSGTDFTGVQSDSDGTALDTLDLAAAGFVAAGGGQAGVDAANSTIENSPYPIDTGDNVEEDPE